MAVCLSGCFSQKLDKTPPRATGGSGGNPLAGRTVTDGGTRGSVDAAPPIDGGSEDGAPTAGADAAGGSPGTATDGSTIDTGPIDTGPIDTGPSRSVNASINAAHDGTQPGDAIASPLTERWSLDIQGLIYSYPIIADGRLFLSYADGQSRVAAYDLNDGHSLWGPIDLPGAPLLTYDSGVLVGLASSGTLSGWDAATGRTLWSEALPMQWGFDAAPVAWNGLIYVNGLGSGGTIYAVDPTTGLLRWSTPYEGGDGAVAIGAGTVYQVSACAFVSALNALTGAVSILYRTDCTGGGGGMPVYADQRIWVPDSLQGNLIIDPFGNMLGSFSSGVPAVHGATAFYGGSAITAVDVVSGTQKWSTAISGACTPLVVAGGGGQLFAGTVSGVLYELDETTGAQVSMDDTTFLGGPACYSPAIAEGRLAFVSGGGVAVY